MPYFHPKNYDVLVIGAGHAGIEAAMAASRLGASTAVLTQNLDTIGAMSCNPAIGGLAKGHMVREIDALGGFMALNSDATGIQFRTLNANKGPSVRAPRAQCDKKAYQLRAKAAVEAAPNLDLHQANISELLVEGDAITGVMTNLGLGFTAGAVIVSAGTFMGGLMHVGLKNQKGGRMGDASSTLSGSLADLGFELKRFKTGTPCRINGRSIDLSVCEIQEGDNPAPAFSYLRHTLLRHENEIFTLNPWGDEAFHVEQMACHLTYTNSQTHAVIAANLDKSPMYSGIIEGTGPRYCPSIEDKVVRFAEKERHQVFIEPEGRHTSEVYINGVSTSMPYEVQYDFIRSIAGLENAEIIRPGYAVEYDFCPPTQLQTTLETKRIAGLYFAGQINGTSGYEEAAGQGLVAGSNAALKLAGKSPLKLPRSESYLGVMVDDLVTKGCTEPYRMFTSRAEYRLLLRQDNADLRLTPGAEEAGLVSRERVEHTTKKAEALADAHALAEKTKVGGEAITDWFRHEGNVLSGLPQEFHQQFSDEVLEVLQTDLKYAGYLKRQLAEIERFKNMEDQPIPRGLDYDAIRGLKTEARMRLLDGRPATLGQASRMQGITPADISVLAVHLSSRAPKGKT